MKVINIEGIDAVGKETVSKALEKTLHEKGFRVTRVSFPIYEADFGKCIKDVLMGACGEAPALDHELMSPLYTLDRISYFKANIDRLLNDYDYVICDRSFYSNFMYQASKIYINNPIYYTLNMPSEMLYWIAKNYNWEFSNTGLNKATDVQTFVLSLSEEDSLKQLGNRTVKDTNEKNRVYLNECKKFINHMMSNDIKECVREINSNRDTMKESLIYYINNVHHIEVVHVDDPKDIDKATMQTVNNIMSHLCENGFVSNENDMSNVFDFKENFSLMYNIAHSLKNLYDSIHIFIDNKVRIEWVEIMIDTNQPIEINFMMDENYVSTCKNDALEQYINHYLIPPHVRLIRGALKDFPYKMRIKYDGQNFMIDEILRRVQNEN